MKQHSRSMVLGLAAVTATGCARRSAPEAPGKIGEAEVVRTVMVIDPNGRFAEPELQSSTKAPSQPVSDPQPAPLTDAIFDCTVDVQCTIVDYGCGDAPPVSVNRDHEALLRERMENRECPPAPKTSGDDCLVGEECETHRLAVCDQRKCARLEFHVMGEIATKITLAHNRFTPQPGEP